MPLEIPSVPFSTPTRVATPADVGLGQVSNVSPANLPLSLAAVAALLGKSDTTHGHADASSVAPGFLSAALFLKLIGIATGATLNAPDAELRDRNTHTGTQPISTIAALQAALDGKRATGAIPLTDIAQGGASVGQVLKWNGTAWVPDTDLNSGGGGGGAVDSVFGRAGAVIAVANDYTFAQIGSKPTTLAGYGITDATPSTHVGSGGAQHAAASGSADGFMTVALFTKLAGISTGATANAADAVLLARANHTGTQAISTVLLLQTTLDAKAPLASPAFTGTVTGITRAMVGLPLVDNVADANKPVSGPQQTALDLKANLTSPTFTGTVSGITAAMVGLANVTNTSDTAKPVSTAQAAAIALKNANVLFSYNGTALGTTGTVTAIDFTNGVGPVTRSGNTLTVPLGGGVGSNSYVDSTYVVDGYVE